MHGLRSGLLVGLVFLAVFGASYGYLQLTAPPIPAETGAPPSSEVATLPPTPLVPPPTTTGQGAPPPVELRPSAEPAPAPSEPTFQNAPPIDEPEAFESFEPAGGSAPLAGGAPLPVEPPPSAPPPSVPPPSVPRIVAPATAPPPPRVEPRIAPAAPAKDAGFSAASPPLDTYFDAKPAAPPPPPPAAPAPPPTMTAAVPMPVPKPLPPAAAADPPVRPRGANVLSYFQQTKTEVDTSKAFGFVLLPRSAVSDGEKRAQKQFCQIMLSSLDFMTPGAVSAAAARTEILATYWPIVATRRALEINAAFEDRNCDHLLAWYDHKLARSLATKAGVAGLSGPLLITWPASGADGAEARNPLVVDFSKADYEHATKTLQYWFRQVRGRPELWTNRIREGTIRAELADAVNDTAGVVLAVLYGKWDSVNTVAMN